MDKPTKQKIRKAHEEICALTQVRNEAWAEFYGLCLMGVSGRVLRDSMKRWVRCHDQAEALQKRVGGVRAEDA